MFVYQRPGWFNRNMHHAAPKKCWRRYMKIGCRRSCHVDAEKKIAMVGIVAIHNPLLLTHGGDGFNALLAISLPVFF
jgi:hypothetical protein